jgi:hypothetical protein
MTDWLTYWTLWREILSWLMLTNIGIGATGQTENLFEFWDQRISIKEMGGTQWSWNHLELWSPYLSKRDAGHKGIVKVVLVWQRSSFEAWTKRELWSQLWSFLISFRTENWKFLLINNDLKLDSPTIVSLRLFKNDAWANIIGCSLDVSRKRVCTLDQHCTLPTFYWSHLSVFELHMKVSILFNNLQEGLQSSLDWKKLTFD